MTIEDKSETLVADAYAALADVEQTKSKDDLAGAAIAASDFQEKLRQLATVWRNQI